MKELNNKAHLKNKMNVKLNTNRKNRNVRDMHSVHLTLTLKIHRRQCMHIDRFIYIAYISIDKSYTQWRNVWGENERLPWNTTNRFVFGQLSLILRVKLVISSISSQRSSQAFNHAQVSGSEFCSARVAPVRFGIRRHCGWCYAASPVLLLWYRGPNPVQVLQDLNNCSV